MICEALRKTNFLESTLLMLEHIFREAPSPETFCRLLHGLLGHGQYDAIKWLVSGHREYLEYEGIKHMYIESMYRLGLIGSIDAGLGLARKPLVLPEARGAEPISGPSINAYYQALVQRGKEKQKKRFLRQALSLDERNLEALICLYINYTEAEVATQLSQMANPRIKGLYAKLFYHKLESLSVFTKHFLSPFSCFRIARSFFNEKNASDSFQLAQYMVLLYPSHHLTLLSIALYYTLTRNFLDAKRALFQSIHLNDTLGIAWLLLGHCQSSLYESVNAINCYEKAEALMEESELASLGIALEYHKMRSYKKAEEKYLEIKQRRGIEKCATEYSSLLITVGRYEEALEIVRGSSTGRQGIIRSFCYLFTSQLEMAESSLGSVDVGLEPALSRKHSVLGGYIAHLKGDFCKAIESYQLALLDSDRGGNNIINDLLELAIKNTLETDDKKIVCEYGEDLFDFLDLKSEMEIRL